MQSREVEEIASPRSTVLRVAELETMSQPGGGTAGEVPSSDLKASPSVNATVESNENANGDGIGGADNKSSAEVGLQASNAAQKESTSPTFPSQTNGYPYPAHLTPQAAQGYYIGYPHQSQVTPEPPSPAGPVYDPVGSFFQQPAQFPPHASPFGVPQTPLSPRQNGASMGGIPPASPLFPRVSNGAGLVPGSLEQQRMMESAAHRPGAPPSPSVPYLSPAFGPNAVYQNYPVNGVTNQSDSPEDVPTWGERNQQVGFQQGSQMNPQGIPIPYAPAVSRAGTSDRSYSFEESMLPPSVDQPEQVNPVYSPYGGTQQSNPAAGVGGTLFAHQQTWGYGGPGDMYGAPASPLQPRPTTQMPMYPGHQMQGGMRHMSMYGQYYPLTSPGPPIQTTESNKGPDGANLFIFHIPNNFSNLDMYSLFCPFGNLLSVRIMVEKDTGRSRGFGFVSYDSPASAAHAIKELNGYAIGNKRLKVQHKQIRPSDQQNRDNSQGFYGGAPAHAESSFQRAPYPSHLPPSGPMVTPGVSSASPWYDPRAIPPPQDLNGDVASSDNPNENSKFERDGDASGVVNPNTDIGSLAKGANESVVRGNTDSGPGLSPLSTLEPLRSALPEVPGTD